MKILITSGGCKVPIDDVRHIGNFSSGRYGAEIASQFMRNPNNHVYFLMEKGSAFPDTRCPKTGGRLENLNDYVYVDYFDYVEKAKALVTGIQPDIIISVAAISDYICDKQSGKISSNGESLTIQLRKADKVIASFRELAPKAIIVGFKCLVKPSAEKKIEAIEKAYDHADLIVYNDLDRLRAGDSYRQIFRKTPHGFSVYNCADAEKLVENIIFLRTVI